jgi:hypothetical protein
MLELVHFLEDVLLYGPASGFSTETGERGLKQWAKAPAKTAQKRSDEVFSKQVCSRIHERVLINGIADAQPSGNESDMEEDDQPVADIIVRPRCANYVVEIGMNSPASIIRILSSTGKRHKMQVDFPPLIVAWFERHYRDPTTTIHIQLYTEIILRGEPGQPGVALRAHPHYQSEGPWYDYAQAVYEDDDGVATIYPCKMVCFFKEPTDFKTMALVQEVNYQDDKQYNRESQLFHHWTLNSKDNRETGNADAVFEVLDVEILTDRIYVIDPAPVGGFSRKTASTFTILQVKYGKEEWPESFLESDKYLDGYHWD